MSGNNGGGQGRQGQQGGYGNYNRGGYNNYNNNFNRGGYNNSNNRGGYNNWRANPPPRSETYQPRATSDLGKTVQGNSSTSGGSGASGTNVVASTSTTATSPPAPVTNPQAVVAPSATPTVEVPPASNSKRKHCQKCTSSEHNTQECKEKMFCELMEERILAAQLKLNMQTRTELKIEMQDKINAAFTEIDDLGDDLTGFSQEEKDAEQKREEEAEKEVAAAKDVERDDHDAETQAAKDLMKEKAKLAAEDENIRQRLRPHGDGKVMDKAKDLTSKKNLESKESKGARGASAKH